MSTTTISGGDRSRFEKQLFSGHPIDERLTNVGDVLFPGVTCEGA